MKKILLILTFFIFSFLNVFSAEITNEEIYETSSWVIIPDEIDWTDRFILTELKELRIDQETLKREIYQDIQAREMSTIDKALWYSANTVNFFFVLLTILIAWFWVVWWKTIGDIKNATKASMDRETTKIISQFQNKIEELEKEQKINILWRQYNTSDSDKEKINILDRIYFIKPESQFVTIEKSNVYLSMWLHEKVIELTDPIVTWDRAKHQPHAFYNRACSFNAMGDKENAIAALNNLVTLAPDYRDMIQESEYLSNLMRNAKVKEILK